MQCDVTWDSEGMLRVRWRCPWCTHQWTFAGTDVSDMGFYIVHHLVQKHSANPQSILANEPGLLVSVEEVLSAER